MFTLDLATFPTSKDLVKAMKASSSFHPQMTSMTGELCWKGIVSGIQINIDAHFLHPNTSWAGLHDSGVITIKHFGKKDNKTIHRGGIVGTIYHEFFHYLQYYGTMEGIGDWYWEVHNDDQSIIHNRWLESFADCYAATKPYEASCEVFRVLAGYTSGETWEGNHRLLKDYFEFFSKNDMTKHFMR